MPTPDPLCIEKSGVIELVIESKEKDLGGFTVRRALPVAKRRLVGPFIFFDQMGPSELPPGKGIDVRPHPHIGLATVTYLFEGEILHRDSLGNVRHIRPGAVNLMTAGKGIVHSERTDPDHRKQRKNLHGIQLWVALPKESEEIEPAFQHYPESDIPRTELDGVTLSVIIGQAFGLSSPVKTYSETIYGEVVFSRPSGIVIPGNIEERAVYVAEGEIKVGEGVFQAGTMVVLCPGRDVRLEAAGNARVMLLGGDRLKSERTIWWNFVSSSKDRIEKAKADWKGGRFPNVPGEDEFIPLPE